MAPELSAGALEAMINGNNPDSPVLQVISSKKITAGSSTDRYRLLLSDGEMTYSHAMLATQLNGLVDDGSMDNLAVIQVDKYLCNTIQGDKRVLILLDVSVLKKGSEVNQRLGNPQQYRPGQENSAASAAPANVASTSARNPSNSAASGPVNRAPAAAASSPLSTRSPSAGASSYSVRGGSTTPGTPGSSRVHSISSLTPYQNRWRIRARVTSKSSIRTWSNSRGEGRLFSVNLIDESGEIRATGFNDAVDKFYELLEVNKVYFISRANLKTANKQYTSIKNDYEMTFNPDTVIELCTEDTNLPSMSFDFVQIGDLERKQPNSQIDVIGVVKTCGDISTVLGRQSQREIVKRDIQIVDQSGMGVNLTLWGGDAEKFDGSNNPVLAVKGAKLSDFGGRSLSVLASSQVILNPDIPQAHMLRGWYDRDGQNMDFSAYRNDGTGAGGGSGTNWKTFSQVKSENLGQGDKADYFTSKGMVLYLRKENCMYQACPTEQCNKKLVDQGNGLYRCEKCNKEFPNYKWRMILSANIADFSDNQWVTCFQESAEALLGRKADELGDLRANDEAAFDQVFQEALFQSFVFKLRAKVETYNDESRLKTVCVSASPMDWQEHGRRLLDDINKMAA